MNSPIIADYQFAALLLGVFVVPSALALWAIIAERRDASEVRKALRARGGKCGAR